MITLSEFMNEARTLPDVGVTVKFKKDIEQEGNILPKNTPVEVKDNLTNVTIMLEYKGNDFFLTLKEYKYYGGGVV